MNRQQSGFTLIELIAVIVILGILAATAVPRFINLQNAANEAAVQNIAGSIESASSLNYAGALAVSADLTVADVQVVEDCDDAASLLEDFPAGYTVTGTAAGLGLGDVGTCTLTHDSSSMSSDFSIYGAPPP